MKDAQSVNFIGQFTNILLSLINLIGNEPVPEVSTLP